MAASARATYSAQSSSASASSSLRDSSDSADLMCTTFSQMRTFFDFSNFARMIFAARGAHEPFSISPTVRFWKLRSTRWSRNVCMNGKISAL